MNERSRNIAVGLTALMGLLVLGFLLILFGYVPGWLESGYVLRVNLPNAAGLRKNGRVHLNGIDIGTITDVQFRDNPRDGVYAATRIEPQVQLPETINARVKADQLLGAAAVLLLEMSDDATSAANERFLPTDGSAVIDGTASSLIDRLLGKLDSAMGGPMSQLSRVANSFETLSSEWSQVGSQIKALTEPRTIEQVESGAKPANVSTVMARADRRLGEMEQVMTDLRTAFEQISRWAGDEKLQSDVKATAANARQLTETLAQRVDELASGYLEVAGELSTSIRELRKMIEKAHSGDGTVAKLLNDPALFQNLNDASERLVLVLDEIKALLEKLKNEGLPIRFGSESKKK